MIINRKLCIAIPLIIVMTCLITQATLAASWSCFSQGTFKDIYVDPIFTNNVVKYTLRLGINPKVVISGNTYPISWISAFYAVGNTESTQFTATPSGTPSDWTWDSKNNSGQIAGWYSDGQHRLYPGESKHFEFGSLIVPSGSSLVDGLHVGYVVNGSTVMTDFRRGLLSVPPQAPRVPELPTGLLGMMGTLFVAGFGKLKIARPKA